MPVSTSFWERRPWLGAILFAVIVSAVGIFLAIQVGERPHLRTSWSLVTEIRQGSYDPEAPWVDDPVRIIVRVRTHDARNEPVVGVQVALVSEGSRVISRGFTAAPEGHIHLPVPERFAKALFNGAVRAVAVVPGGETAWGDIPMPEKGLTSLQIALPATRAIQVAVVDAEGELVSKVGRVTPRGADSIAPVFSAPWELERGMTTIAGVPINASLVLETRVEGHEPMRSDVAAGQESIDIPLGTPFARLSVTISNTQNQPLRNQTIRLQAEDGTGARPTQLVRTDRDGLLRADLRPGDLIRVILTTQDRTRGAFLETSRLEPSAAWNPGAVRIDAFPVLLRGRILNPQGAPCAGAMVTVRPWGRAGRVETTRANQDTGSFVLRGAPFSGPLLVTAFHEGLAGRLQTQVAHGTDSMLTLQLAPPGRISGTVDAASALVERGVTVNAVLPGVRDSRAAIHASHVERDGSFELLGVAAGIYDILVVAPGAKPRVIDEVVVSAGADAPDARLASIRLR